MTATEWNPTFFIVPNHIMSLPGLTLSFLKVYESIFQFWNKGKSCFLSDKLLMDRANIGQSQLYEAFAYFEKHKELIRRKINGKRYLVRPEICIEITMPNTKITSAEAEPDFRQSGSTTSAGAEHNIKNLNKEININNIPDFPEIDFFDYTETQNNNLSVRSDYYDNQSTEQHDDNEHIEMNKEPVKSDYRNNKTNNNPIGYQINQINQKTIKHYKDDERFMRFYSIYPKKEDPQDAWKAFKSIVGGNDELLDKIVQDVELRKLKHSKWKDKQFIKHPATYLRKGEYLGEIFNAEDEILAKKEKEAIAANERIALQEKAFKEREERERMHQRQKETDAAMYRQIVKQVPSQVSEIERNKLRSLIGSRHPQIILSKKIGFN